MKNIKLPFLTRLRHSIGIYRRYRKINSNPFSYDVYSKDVFENLSEKLNPEIRAFVYKELDMIKKQQSIINQSAKIVKPESFLSFFKNPKYHHPGEYDSDLDPDDDGDSSAEF